MQVILGVPFETRVPLPCEVQKVKAREQTAPKLISGVYPTKKTYKKVAKLDTFYWMKSQSDYI